MSNNNLYVEPREGGGYSVSRPNAKRASAVADTQAEAIAKAKQLDGDAAIHVARVRNVTGGKPDKYRKL